MNREPTWRDFLTQKVRSKDGRCLYCGLQSAHRLSCPVLRARCLVGFLAVLVVPGAVWASTTVGVYRGLNVPIYGAFLFAVVVLFLIAVTSSRRKRK